MGVWTKFIVHWFIERQTQFGMPRGDTMRLALNLPNRLLFIQIQTLPPSILTSGLFQFYFIF